MTPPAAMVAKAEPAPAVAVEQVVDAVAIGSPTFEKVQTTAAGRVVFRVTQHLELPAASAQDLLVELEAASASTRPTLSKISEWVEADPAVAAAVAKAKELKARAEQAAKAHEEAVAKHAWGVEKYRATLQDGDTGADDDVELDLLAAAVSRTKLKADELARMAREAEKVVEPLRNKARGNLAARAAAEAEERFAEASRPMVRALVQAAPRMVAQTVAHETAQFWARTGKR